jgi:hypothetical protein
MNKKISAIALALFVFSAATAVFAEVCLSNNVARVRNNGNSVLVVNAMNNASINVEIDCIEKIPARGMPRKKTVVWAYNLSPLGSQSVPIPEGYMYAGTYTVWSCSTN